MQHGTRWNTLDSEAAPCLPTRPSAPTAALRSRPSRKILPNFYDEYAAYDIWGTTCKRLDWQTGKLTTASLPFVQLDGTCGAIGSKVLLTRVVSDTPLPEGEGREMRDAVAAKLAAGV